MQRLRLIEFLGGPLDGSTPVVAEEQDRVVYTDGATVWDYVLDEVHEGQGVREVMRMVAAVPIPGRKA